MRISVIIPAYMAESYIEKAVQSASALPEVQEIIIVEDGSTDGTLNTCLQLEKRESKVKVHRHPGGVNRGASASRNLGINSASEELIAFLDADDFYLRNRFRHEISILSERSDVDGVYGAITANFLTKTAAKRFSNAKMHSLTTISKAIGPDELVYVLLGMSDQARGHFHLDGLTLRRSVFSRAGLFDENLRYGEDTDLMIRIAFKGKLVPGSIEEPIAIRGVHDTNHITNVRRFNSSKSTLWQKIHDWGKANGMPEGILVECHHRAIAWRTYQEDFTSGLIFLLKLRKRYPEVWSNYPYFRRAVMGVFGDTLLARVIVKGKTLV